MIRWTPIGLCIVVSLSLWGHEGTVRGKASGRDDRIKMLVEDVRIVDSTRGAPRAEWQAAVAINTIDTLTFAKMKEDGVPINALCDDSTFIRRLHLLLTGRLPDPERTRSFLADSQPDKRSTLIDEVLASEAFTTHWSFYFQETFGSTAQVLRKGHHPYNDYLTEAVSNGKALNTMAYELMTASGISSEVAETNYIVRSAAMSRNLLDVWDNAAVDASARFLGVPLNCISCHDGQYHLEEINLYLSDKKRSDLWAMSAFFSDYRVRPAERGENGNVISVEVRSIRPGYEAASQDGEGDRPARNGGLIEPKYLFTGQGLNGEANYRKAFAEQIIADRQFARNFANRFWGELFGLAMVEPMDSFDLLRIDPNVQLPEGWEMQVLDVALLEHTTDKMIEFNYDMRAYLRYLCNSATFQMDSVFHPGQWQERWAPYYSRYLAHHMDAETIYDSVVVATGVPINLRQSYFQEDVITQVQYAHELNDVNQPRGGRFSDVTRFLAAFGRGNRDDIERTNDNSLAQALLMMNSPMINAQVSNRTSRPLRYAEQGLNGEEIVEALFLDILCRKPSDEEAQAMLTELAKYSTGREQAETALWLLINRVDFSFVY